VARTDDATQDLTLVAGFLARRDVDALTPAALAGPADLLVLCGSAVLRSVEVVADAVRAGAVHRVLVSGGRGHSTAYLEEAVRRLAAYDVVPTEGRPEAVVLADLLRLHGVPDEVVDVETASTNCGENARFSTDWMGAHLPAARSVVVVQDPTMQRRTHAGFERCLRGRPEVRLASYAPLLPVVGDDEVCDERGEPVWSRSRFESLVLGEVERLRDDEHGYGPNGADFIDHVDLPVPVEDAYRRLVRSLRAERRVARGR
jgi:uncharacterized SAM-binding protein YcdF (DUF218 family)